MKRRNWWFVYSDVLQLLKVCLKTYIGYVTDMVNGLAHLQQPFEGFNKLNTICSTR